MTTLTGKKPANTYKDLLQVSNLNSGIDGTLRSIEDGEGTLSPLQLSETEVNIGSGFKLNGASVTANATELNQLTGVTLGDVVTKDVDIALGVPTLDGGGKIQGSQLPNTLMDLKGEWNASTNFPPLADGAGNAGDVYEVTTAGTQDLGSGNITFAIGDWVVYSSGNVWFKSINSNAVSSVFGRTGIVSAAIDDYSKSQIAGLKDTDTPIFASGLGSDNGVTCGVAFAGTGFAGTSAIFKHKDAAISNQYSVFSTSTGKTIINSSGQSLELRFNDGAAATWNGTTFSAANFSGIGTLLTALNATNISTGTLNNARLPSAISVTSLSGNGSGITALNATQLTTGTVPSARLTGTYSGIDKLQINDVGATTGGVYLGTSNQINSSSTISQSDVYVPLSITTSTDNEPRIMVRNANTASTEIQGIGFTQPNQSSRYANDGASINVKFGPDRFNSVDSQFVFRTSKANIGGLNNLFSFSRNGTLGIGKLDAVYQLELTIDSAGKPNGGSWANSSDERIKKDITPLTGALDKIIQLNGVNFKWKNPKDHADHEGIQGGFLAQNIEEVFPEWVKDVDGGDLDKELTEDGKIKSLTLPFEFDAYIIEALKELKAENDILKSQVHSLLN